MKPATVSVSLIALMLAGAFAQETTAPAIEVATVKLTDPAFGGELIVMPSNGTLTTRGLSLKGLIEFAYGLHERLVVGGPIWMDRDRYDIVIKPEGDRVPSRDERKGMLKVLLAERFKLKFHREPRETTVYVLLVGKNGPKMKARKPDDGGDRPSLLFRGPSLPGRDVLIGALADALQDVVFDRPVLDKTGLTGRYDFDLKWAPDETQFGGRGGDMQADPDTPSIFVAIQDQLGLKLDSRKAPLEAIVVDHAEKPEKN